MNDKSKYYFSASKNINMTCTVLIWPALYSKTMLKSWDSFNSIFPLKIEVFFLWEIGNQYQIPKLCVCCIIYLRTMRRLPQFLQTQHLARLKGVRTCLRYQHFSYFMREYDNEFVYWITISIYRIELTWVVYFVTYY